MQSLQSPDSAVPKLHDANTDFSTAPQIESLVRLQSHCVIKALHHSAQNTETARTKDHDMTTWNIELCFPSRYTERFRFYNPMTPGPRSRRASEVVEDILRTVRLMLRYSSCPEVLAQNLCVRLQAAWKMNSFDTFKAAIGEINRQIEDHPFPPLDHLPRELVHCFFDQLYDRAVFPYTKDLNKGKAGLTYGEMRPTLLSEIFERTDLGQNSVYLDLGSGIGNTAMQAALETGCEAHGIEIQPYAHLVSVNHLQQFHARAILWGIEPGAVALHFGNFLHSPLIDDLLPAVDVVLINNFKFDPESDEQLRSMLDGALKVGAQVVLTRSLSPAGRSRSVDRLFSTQVHTYESGSVSWTDSPGTYYIATKQCVARRSQTHAGS